jgi:serine/threonine-protein kinase
VLLPDLEDAPDLAERFSREVKVQASLAHPNIAALHTAVRVDRQLLMIMEWVPGVSLRERLSHGPIEVRESINYGCQVLSALGYAHQRGIVHRDIKPANIMVTPEKQVKVMDFGIAAVKGAGQTLTMTGMALGSLHYMSPEQVQSGHPDGRADLYSLGVTLYEMVTGQCPIQGESEYAIMTAHLNLVPPSPSDLNPFLPPAFSLMIMRALEKRPADRFQTADEFRAALESLSGKPPAAPPREISAERATPVPHESSGVPAGQPLDAAVLEKATKELAAYIGPLARIIVSRAAKRAQSVRQLYQEVAGEIPAAADRAKFLAKNF